MMGKKTMKQFQTTLQEEGFDAWKEQRSDTIMGEETVIKVIHSRCLLEMKVYSMWVFKLVCKTHVKSKIHQNCTKCKKTLASIISYVQTHSVQQQTEALCRDTLCHFQGQQH